MIDICTVVFDQEIDILKLQAQSIDLYCKDIGVNSIYIIVNDGNHVAGLIDPEWWGSFKDRVVIIPRSAFGSTWSDNGWVSQQVLKLLGASISYNTYTMVLDAKTIFVRDLLLDELLNDQQQLCVGQIPVQSVFNPSKQIVESLFGVNIDLQAGPGGVPYFFHNNTVRELIVTVSSTIDKPFPVWFQEQGMLTEFILYSGFVIKRYGSLNKFYSTESRFLIQNVCHSEVGIYEIKLNQAINSKDNLTISVHRGAWVNLTAQQRAQYKDFLASKSISLAWILN